MKIISMAMILLLVSTTACSSIKENPGAATGAGVGAVTGAALGKAVGKSTGSAVVGGLLGGLAGGAVGHYGYDQKKDRNATMVDHPNQKSGVTVEKAEVSPKTVSPGAQVDLGMTYAVLTPGGAGAEVTETREITHNGQLVGNPQVQIRRADGTYTSDIPLTLPQNADRGEYRVTMTAKSAQGSDTKETTFTVQ